MTSVPTTPVDYVDSPPAIGGHDSRPLLTHGGEQDILDGLSR